MPFDTSVDTAKDGQESTSTDNPLSTARDGADEAVEDDALHAYFMFHATPEQLQQVQARLHNHAYKELEGITMEVH